MHLRGESIETPLIVTLSHRLLLPRWQVLNLRYLRSVGWSLRGLERRFKLPHTEVRAGCQGVRLHLKSVRIPLKET
jgi:hypothetical protein